jgi:hypothetical protein
VTAELPPDVRYTFLSAFPAAYFATATTGLPAWFTSLPTDVQSYMVSVAKAQTSIVDSVVYGGAAPSDTNGAGFPSSTSTAGSHNFQTSTAGSHNSSTGTSGSAGTGLSSGAKAGVGIGVVATALLFVIALLLFWNRRHSRAFPKSSRSHISRSRARDVEGYTKPELSAEPVLERINYRYELPENNAVHEISTGH